MRFLFKTVIDGWIGKLVRFVLFYGSIIALVLLNFKGQSDLVESTIRFHKHLDTSVVQIHYTPKNLDKYIEILEKEFKTPLGHLKDIKFYPLIPNDLWIACNFHEDTNKYTLYGCYFDYNKTIYINMWVIGSCSTELHELAHSAIAYTDYGGGLNDLLNSTHKHPIYKPNPLPMDEHNTKIEDLCKSNHL